MYGVFFRMFLPYRKSLCHAACCDKPFLPRKGRQYRLTWIQTEQPAYLYNAGDGRRPSPQPEESGLMPVRHEKGSDGFFSLSHMHYVGRSFRLLNPPPRSVPALSGVFPVKISPCGNFCRKPEKRRSRGRRTLMKRKNRFVHNAGTISQMASYLLHLFPAYGTGFPCRC